ncbi:ABC transporter permease [Allorhizocola rhizosphaerae]|uniref:ABC transporter permease n=1 Tax=Allorhizocola rhizosphaerae TaxID=1872709 RepID=UPI001FE2E610|nr:ABC transporter permease [Allorhizocola rhizosphaerae]
MITPIPPGTRLSPLDVLRLGTIGIRMRPVRTTLAALGIAIGIAALIAMIGIPASNQAAVQAELAALGPNLLTVSPGQDMTTGDKAKLPPESVGMVGRVGPVESVTALGFTSAKARRSDRVPPGETGGLLVSATRLDLPEVLQARLSSGVFLNAATERYPVAVLGARAAHILGLQPDPGLSAPLVWLDNRWFTVVGTLAPLPLAPEVDNSVLIGWTAAQQYLGFDGSPSRIFVRVEGDAVEAAQAVLGRTVNPAHPEHVLVSRPSEALAAQRLVANAYSSLFLGLGAVALLVGGIGVANTMVISVLERRREIGLRRALGASRRHVGGQFLAESVVLTALGGALGLLLGTAFTAVYAVAERWPAVLPPGALLGGVGVSVLIGILAGVYPAARAARLAPTTALATS